MASAETTLPKLLSSLISSLESATDSVPEADSLIPPRDAQSLLTVKNELFLSYVHNLVFLIMLKLRHHASTKTSVTEAESLGGLHEQVVEKLVELRLYLDKGVKPLETKLTYQIDRVIRAAEEASRSDKAKVKGNERTKKREQNGTASDESASDSGSGSDSSSEEDEAEYAVSALNRPARLIQAKNESRMSSDRPGIYKPPRIHPTALPLTTTNSNTKTKTARHKPSVALDEFVSGELASAPLVEPSIGSTIRDGGRRNMTRRERNDADEKRRYEEENFVRLGAPSKKELKRMGGGAKRRTYGGEEWGDLNGAVDRISGLTRRKDAGGQLERSRKRAVDLSGASRMGEGFDKRRKM
jgi:U3 small nucleolar ribonucleoprotein protein LCP5